MLILSILDQVAPNIWIKKWNRKKWFLNNSYLKQFTPQKMGAHFAKFLIFYFLKGLTYRDNWFVAQWACTCKGQASPLLQKQGQERWSSQMLTIINYWIIIISPPNLNSSFIQYRTSIIILSPKILHQCKMIGWPQGMYLQRPRHLHLTGEGQCKIS